MLIKMISCDVLKDRKNDFSIAQEAWNEISHSQGLIAQFGGWDAVSDNKAIIIAFWKDSKSYQEFMKSTHDSITKKINQKETYSSVSTNLFEYIFEMQGKLDEIGKQLNQAMFMRLAEMCVDKGRKEHFTNTQSSVWLPGMKECEGMLGGNFSLEIEDQKRFLTLSFWESEELHQKFVSHNLSTLRKRAEFGRDVEEVTVWKVRLNHNWTVSNN